MSSWEIRLPIRDRDAPIGEVALDAHVLEDPEERATIRELTLGAVLAGDKTAGDLLDRLAGAGVGGRRQMLDAAREAAGLKSATDIDDAERFEAVQRVAHHRKRSTEQPRLNGVGGIEIPLSPAELADAQRKDELREQANEQRREQREYEAAERRAAQEAADERWRPTGPGWTS